MEKNKCLFRKKELSAIWKRVNVSPQHKKGPGNVCNNYRPVSLLSCTGNVFEKIVFKHVFNFFRDNLVYPPINLDSYQMTQF